MIKNIIFDVGMVLVDFSWEKVLHQLGITGEDFERVAEATVRSPLWNEYDRSSLSDEEILQGFIANAPEAEAHIRAMWEHIGDMITCYPYTRPWIRELKANGYGCYVLSNYPKRSYELTKKELSFTEEMDGGIFSYEVQLIKPEPEIFQALMDKYQLQPQECVFLDDNLENIQGARAFGLPAIHFQTKEQAETELKKLIAG